MIRILPLFLFLLLLASCSSTVRDTASKEGTLLTFDVYDQTLETVLHSVADKYEYDLEFNLPESSQLWSLSVFNADIKDTLSKISAATGSYFKIDDDEIIFQNELFEEDTKILQVKLNSNLWKDFAMADVKEIDESAVRRFFGPLLKDSEVISIDRSSQTLELRILPQNETFIRKSLSLLNYTQHDRKLIISLYVVETQSEEVLQAENIPQKNLKFAWSINAGDNIKVNLKDGAKVSLRSTDLSDLGNLNAKRFELAFTYNTFNSTRVFDDPFERRKVIKLNDKTYLLVMADWYIDNERLKGHLISSALLAEKAETDYKNLPQVSMAIQDAKTPLDWCIRLNKGGEKIKYVQFSKIDTFKKSPIKLEGKSFADLIKKFCEKTSMVFKIHKNGILLVDRIHSGERQTFWAFTPEGEKDFSYKQGAFIINLKNQQVNLLPSASAYVNDAPMAAEATP